MSLVQRAGGKHVEDIEVLLAVLDRKLRALCITLEAADPVKGNLVSVDWLEKNLKDADLLILDASAAQIYKAQHIPGALNVDLFSYGAQEPSVPEMEQRLQSVGVSRGKKILIYDQGGSFMATRLFYDLYYYGYPAKDLLILDGGLAKWKAAGGSITKDPTPAPQKGSFRITTINEYARVKLPEISDRERRHEEQCIGRGTGRQLALRRAGFF